MAAPSPGGVEGAAGDDPWSTGRLPVLLSWGLREAAAAASPDIVGAQLRRAGVRFVAAMEAEVGSAGQPPRHCFSFRPERATEGFPSLEGFSDGIGPSRPALVTLTLAQDGAAFEARLHPAPAGAGGAAPPRAPAVFARVSRRGRGHATILCEGELAAPKGKGAPYAADSEACIAADASSLCDGGVRLGPYALSAAGSGGAVALLLEDLRRVRLAAWAVDGLARLAASSGGKAGGGKGRGGGRGGGGSGGPPPSWPPMELLAATPVGIELAFPTCASKASSREEGGTAMPRRLRLHLAWAASGRPEACIVAPPGDALLPAGPHPLGALARLTPCSSGGSDSIILPWATHEGLRALLARRGVAEFAAAASAAAVTLAALADFGREQAAPRHAWVFAPTGPFCARVIVDGAAALDVDFFRPPSEARDGSVRLTVLRVGPPPAASAAGAEGREEGGAGAAPKEEGEERLLAVAARLPGYRVEEVEGPAAAAPRQLRATARFRLSAAGQPSFPGALRELLLALLPPPPPPNRAAEEVGPLDEVSDSEKSGVAV